MLEERAEYANHNFIKRSKVPEGIRIEDLTCHA